MILATGRCFAIISSWVEMGCLVGEILPLSKFIVTKASYLSGRSGLIAFTRWAVESS